MESKIINQFPIRDYLADSGIYPAKDNGYYGMYHSPFRDDHNASMKVDYSKNLWIDYGTNEGGTLVDLVMRMANCSSGKAMQLLEQQIAGTSSFSFHGKKDFVPARQEQANTIHKVSVLTNPGLLDYLSERNINIYIAKQHCQEIHYSVNGKPYFAVGFRNDAGGYELRNKYFQGSLSPKGITTIRNENDVACIFEGFIDYLSYLTLRLKHNPEQWNIAKKQDYIVLNSVANLSKALDIIEGYTKGYCFLDNDKAGFQAWLSINDRCGLKASDQSVHYREYKDLNDYLCGKKLLPKKQVRKGFKL